MKYFALLTKLGENLLAQATALGTKIELTHMAVGDGGGSLPTPDTNQTKLIKEQRRAAINTLFIDEQNKNQIVAEQIIPEKDGGWWIREIGLFDKDGNLIAVANCPETYKPQLVEGSGRTQSIRMVLIVSHTESVTLKIDPSVVLATREYVDTAITVLDKKIDTLLAQTKLDLAKKIDKANITHQSGDSKELVASQWLLSDLLKSYIKLGQFGLGTKSSTQLTKLAKDWHTNGFWIGELENGVTMAMGFSVNHINSAYGFNFYARNSKIYYTCTENGVKSKELQVWTENNFNPTQYALLTDVDEKLAAGNYATKSELNTGLAGKQPTGDYATNAALNNGLGLKFDKNGGVTTGYIIAANEVGARTDNAHISLITSDKTTGPHIASRKDGTTTFLKHVLPSTSGTLMQIGDCGIGASSSPALKTYSKDWNNNGFWRGNINNSVTMTFGISCNHMDGLYTLNIYGRNKNVFFSTRENGIDSVVDGTFHTSANTITDRNGYLRSSTSTVEMQAVPIGGSIIWNSTAPIPDNFWPNEGRSFSASEYPELAKILPSLKLPDDRGYAIRIADNGKGIDAGRTVGTYQDCAIENIVGEIHANIPGSASGVFSYRANGSRAEGGAPTGGSWKFDASTQVRTANETRMKNVAKILITRVK